MATVTLNRPAALNALTLAMLEGLASWLDAWEGDERVRVVALRGAGDKAFCAGGDIRELRDMFVAGSGRHDHFFEVEYGLDHRIHTYPKPVVAVMDGIAMGGGMGIAQGAALRIAGPRTKVAMPETRIGFFPDVGGTWFLQKGPGDVPMYLGLTGVAIGGADSLYAGLVDACFSPASIASLDAELPRVAAAPDPRAALADLGRRHAVAQGPGELEALRPAIDRHFGRASVAAIVASLLAEDRPEFHGVGGQDRRAPRGALADAPAGHVRAASPRPRPRPRGLLPAGTQPHARVLRAARLRRGHPGLDRGQGQRPPLESTLPHRGDRRVGRGLLRAALVPARTPPSPSLTLPGGTP